MIRSSFVFCRCVDVCTTHAHYELPAAIYRLFGFCVAIFTDFAGEIPGIMKATIVFALCFAALVGAEEFCYKDVNRACSKTANKQTKGIQNCNAKYGAIDSVLPDLQKYVTSHITRSFEYLLMSTHYGNYEKNREGFQKFFQGLSDEKWDAAIDIIKHITKRGGRMDFNQRKTFADVTTELYELPALARALDIEKELAEDAFNIHAEASHKRSDAHDPEIVDYIEHEFVHQQAELVRKITGMTSDLSKILDGPDHSIGMYLFDQILAK